MENIPTLQVPIHTFAVFAFYLITIAYLIFTIIFYYHWQNYSMSTATSVQTYLAYFLISLPLLALMGLSVLAI